MPSEQLRADDSVLVRWAQDGHSEAFEHLVRRHRVPVYRTALRLTGDAHTADDVTQDAFIAAWKSLQLFQAESSFATWLYRIVVNRARNTYRSRRDVPVEEVPVDGYHPGADTEAIAREGTDRVMSAIVELPFEQRAAFVLRLFEELPYEEIAQILSITPDAVRGRLHRARHQLAKTLGGER
ncbi:MAG: sigma-70 family RNA polymerase sigma factor [Geodermatophilaceae bacterium]|nr:sigma-70 family RNA polymerase sigma factor [Geodermatophilaceae bacterium]